MKQKVTVVDYGIGNLLSVSRAFEKCGAEVAVTDDPAAIASAERVVIPGVGAFADGVAELDRRGLVAPIRRFAAEGRPLLGICLGMQLLFGVSEEFGMHEGLGLIPGRVVAIPNAKAKGGWRKTPHIGWNELCLPPGRDDWKGTILQDVPLFSAMYFVHSFTVVPDDPAARLADCDYEGTTISAAVQAGKVAGCQFHPEKSGETGLRVIRNFLFSS